jgi:hypothetical protein
VLISAGALILAAIHLLRPKANIDPVTIVLIAVAAVPWLAPVFKSIELPGGWKFEFQQQLTQVQNRVQQVERAIFSREVSPDLAHRLGEELETFHDYLAALGLAPYERRLPEIGLQPYQPGSYYDPNTRRIEISPELTDSPHILFREYCNYSLTLDNESVEFTLATYDLKSGLGFYLPCSFTSDPAGFSSFGISLVDTRSMIQRDGTPSPENQPRAYIWASIFWEARQLIGSRTVDKMAADAWLATVAAADDSTARPGRKPDGLTYQDAEEWFVRHLLDSEEGQSLRDLLTRRRVLQTTGQ